MVQSNIIQKISKFTFTTNIINSTFCYNEKDYVPLFGSKEIEDYLVEQNARLQYKPVNKNTILSELQQAPVVNIVIESSSFFYPRKKDTLFYIFYWIVNGEFEYEKIKKNNFVIIRQLKIKYIEKIKDFKKQLKLNKCKPLTYINNNLLNESAIDMNTFHALCIMENIDFIYIHKNTCYEFNNCGDIGEEICDDVKDYNAMNVIHYNKENDSYHYEYDFKENKQIDKYLSYFKLTNLQGKIKAIGNYKVDELIKICNELNISIINTETHKQKTKPYLYDSIKQYI
jgi:hypothetical protein